MDFYASRIERLTREMDNERPHAYRQKLGIAFIMFERREMALAVLADLNPAAFANVKREAPRDELMQMLDRVNEYRAPGTAPVRTDSCCRLCCCTRWYTLRECCSNISVLVQCTVQNSNIIFLLTVVYYCTRLKYG